MTKVFIRHKVEDYTAWKKAFDNFLPQRKAGGELSYSIGHVQNEPNNLCVTFKWDSADNANVFLQSDELKAAMQAATVTEAPDIFVFESIEEGQT